MPTPQSFLYLAPLRPASPRPASPRPFAATRPRARAACLPSTPAAPAGGHAPGVLPPSLPSRPALPWRRPSPTRTRTRPAGAREPAVPAVSWAGHRADVARDAGRFRSRLRRLRLSCHPGLYENSGPRVVDDGRRAAGGEEPLCALGTAGAEAERSAQAEPVSVPAARASRSPAPGGASAHLAGVRRSLAGRPAVERARAVAARCTPLRAPLPAGSLWFAETWVARASARSPLASF